jgi:S-DNA-T family DNA segregation ATPase FtsK/SpoIIIE
VNNEPGVNELLELLGRLREAIRTFTSREEELGVELRAKSAVEIKVIDTADWKVATELAEGMAGAEAVLQAGKAERETQFEKGKARIVQAHRAARKQAAEQIEQWEGKGKYQLQKSALENDRHRETELANAAARLEEFKQKQEESRASFMGLETKAYRAFRGYGKLRRRLRLDPSADEAESPAAEKTASDEYHLLEELGKLDAKVRERLVQFRRRYVSRLFGTYSVWPLIIFLLAVHGAGVPLLHYFGVETITYQEAGASLAGLLAFLAIGYFVGRGRASPIARAVADDLAMARRCHEVCLAKAETRHRQEQERLKNEFELQKGKIDEQWRETVREAAAMRETRPQQIDAKQARVAQKLEQLHRKRLERLEHNHAETAGRLNQRAESQQQEIAATRKVTLARLNAESEEQWQKLEQEWRGCVEPIWQTIQAANAAAEECFPDWRNAAWDNWQPPQEFKNATKFAQLEVAVEKFAETKPESRRRPLPCPAVFSVPLLLTYPRQGSLLFETAQSGGEAAVAAINNILFRLLSTTPPGKLAFTIIDPIGLGQSFAGLMHLADYAESYINGRIWTQTQQIDEKLAELNEHMEKVIQMYLRNEYATIAEYNARAGAIAEKYHFLVIAGFPANFSETAGRRLINIAASGARCGVYTLIHWDQRHELPHDFIADELRKHSICLVAKENGFTLANHRLPGTRLTLDAPPSPERAIQFLRQVGQSSRDAGRVEVPFTQVAPPEAQVWTGDTTEELRVPIGRSGATKLQYLAVGKGTRQHALIAGKTGSGKSTLFHVMITNLALWCSPEQVEFYLVDFKKGVEFKCYATRRLPQARVVAIESDREFGLSVLQRVDEELRRRGDLFRQLGVQDVPGYKKASGGKPLPRCLLIIDEFQEYFVEEDRVSQNAAVLLDRIVRQGRAFGIHVLLGSQTLGGAYTLARATLGQMVIRIALQCNEADAYLIMEENNAAPRLLSRPGEGIYNDATGSIEGNSPFQTVWLPDEVRDRVLAKIRARADQGPQVYPGPLVFEGNAPAEVRENELLRRTLQAEPAQAPTTAHIWLGAPNSIKGPTEATFQRQSGSHLLVVGQREEAAMAMMAIALVTLAAQYPVGRARFIVLDSAAPGTRQHELLEQVTQCLPHPIVRPRHGDLAEALNGLAEGLKQPASDDQADTVPTYLFIHHLENYRKLRQEDDFNFSLGTGDGGPNPAALLVNLISEGPSRGLHVITTCDTYNNVLRFLGRKTLSEIAMRVLFQMSSNDSANLIEAPDASNLGLHRALFFNEQEGYLETFRPYALPDNSWLEEVGRRLLRHSAEPAEAERRG